MGEVHALAAEREVIFVGGKGGVGKTAVASALALGAARSGRRALVVSTDPAHNLGHLWGREVGDEPVDLLPASTRAGGLRSLEIDPARTTEDHLRAVRSTLQRLMPERLHGEVARHLDLARDAPGTHEAAVLERLAEVLEQRRPGELVVVDTAPSGHTARLLALPEMMQAWTDGLLRRQERSARFGAAARGLAPDGGERGGARDRRERRDEEIRAILERRQARLGGMRDLLQDEQRAAFVIVLAAERLPVLESAELHAQLSRAGMSVGALVVNKRSPAGAGDLLAARREVEDGHLTRLAELLPGLPVTQIPLLAGEVLGEEGLDQLGQYL
ncbi:TRC40/GET3/ArsA family transport-energizing ATPase [Marihabitans asiaticum]|uniref:Arsenite efflux ATP-binding protein ArsA n=1 Tax=Marihabitans asiaticum TaxID=415218 RepID=A0A560WA34_9MICO|nr:ArsA family ATPase [Marihabitans asiaticum]TWD14493.1 arsenite efflux ATP-binding protein ArsA [Marihabitans asiaticum]